MKRWLLKLALFLLLLGGGAIVNVAVAWAFAAYAPIPLDIGIVTHTEGLRWPARLPNDFPTRPTHVVSEHGRGFERSELAAFRRSFQERTIGSEILNQEQAVWESRDEPELREPMLQDIAHRRSVLESSEDGNYSDYRAICISAGWPLLSCVGVRWLADRGPPPNIPRASGVVGAAEIAWNPLTYRTSTPVTMNAFENRLLPFIPIWPGFAINTGFYAVVLWLLFAAPFVLRRRLRVKRGLCPKCAYDLRGSAGAEACPECGNAMVKREVVA